MSCILPLQENYFHGFFSLEKERNLGIVKVGLLPFFVPTVEDHISLKVIAESPLVLTVKRIGVLTVANLLWKGSCP